MIQYLLPFLMAEGDGDTPPADPPPMDGAPPLDPNNPPPADQPTPGSGAPGLMGDAAKKAGEPAPGQEPPAHPADAPPAPPQSAAEKPDYLPEQFWNKEKGEVDLKAFSKSYADVRNQYNKLVQDGGGTPLQDPEDYLKDFTPPTKGRPGVGGEEGMPLDRFQEGLDAQDPAFLAAAKAAKKASMTKKQFDEFVISYMEEANKLLPEPINVENEMKLLGDGGETLVKTNLQWINSLKVNGVLNEDQYNLLMDFGATALGVQLTNALRINSGEKPIPVGASVNNGAKTPAECQAMIANPLYHKDGAEGDAYRAEVEAEFIKTYGTAKQA